MITREQIEAAEAKAYVEPEVVRAALSRVPPSWGLIEARPSGGAFRRGQIQVLYTVQRYDDGRVWLHVSATGRIGRGEYRYPTWDEMKRVKHDFIGDRWAYQVFPPESKYINQHPTVLHLFALMDEKENALPDFTWGLGGL